MGLGFFRLVMSLWVIDQHYKWSINYIQPYFVEKFGLENFGFIGLGHAAVMAFFVLSGYVIAWVLHNKYPIDYQGVKAFFAGRFMRIYPLYWFILTLVTIGFVLAPGPASDYPQLELERIIGDYLLLPYAFIGFFFFLNKYAYGMIDFPAWTLPYDLLFYLIAPWVVTRKKVLIAIIAFELIYLFGIAYFGDQSYSAWHQGYLTTGHAAILAFCVGALAFYYRDIQLPVIAVVAAIAVHLYIAFFPYGMTNYYLNHVVNVFAAAVIVIGFKKRSKFDSLLGELTYSTYLLHMPLFHMLQFFGVPFYTFFALALTYILSIATVKYFEGPIERRRAEMTRDMLSGSQIPATEPIKGTVIVLGLLGVLLVVSGGYNFLKLT